MRNFIKLWMQSRNSVMKVNLVTLQDAQHPQIQAQLTSLLKTKKIAALNGDEELANSCWREIEALELNIQFISAFDKIKNRQYREAWCELEKCEIKCLSLEENSDDLFLKRSRTSFIKDKVAKWQSIYPYCVFASPGFTVGYYSCSICGHKIRPRSRCEHKKGKVYNGKLCVHVAHDMEFRELSIVTNPVQKYSVFHNDETLDFSLVEHLASLLENAFENWDLNWTRKKFPMDRFSNVAPSDDCPCKSGGKFENCCIKKEAIDIPHVDFILSKKIPDEKMKVRFPY